MRQELENLAEDFGRYRGKRKRVKYPQALWDRATELCKHLSSKQVAETLQVSFFTLQRHLKSGEKVGLCATSFIPLQIAHPMASIQLHVKGPLPMTIDFSRSTEEFAKLMLAIQKGLSC